MNFIIKVLWLENSLGVAVNQSNAGHAQILLHHIIFGPVTMLGIKYKKNSIQSHGLANVKGS